MAHDRLFFQNPARLSPSTHVPVGALIVQGIWAGILAFSGSFDTLTDYPIFGSWIFYGLVTASSLSFAAACRTRNGHIALGDTRLCPRSSCS